MGREPAGFLLPTRIKRAGVQPEQAPRIQPVPKGGGWFPPVLLCMMLESGMVLKFYYPRSLT